MDPWLIGPPAGGEVGFDPRLRTAAELLAESASAGQAERPAETTPQAA